MNRLDRLAHDISAHGIRHHDAELRALADRAFRLGVNPTITAILADSGSPEVARERAFARVVGALGNRPPTLGVVA